MIYTPIETLTEEDRVLVNIKMLPGGKESLAKLLRIHDRLIARVSELEDELQEAVWNAMGEDL